MNYTWLEFRGGPRDGERRTITALQPAPWLKYPIFKTKLAHVYRLVEAPERKDVRVFEYTGYEEI